MTFGLIYHNAGLTLMSNMTYFRISVLAVVCLWVSNTSAQFMKLFISKIVWQTTLIIFLNIGKTENLCGTEQKPNTGGDGGGTNCS